MKKAFIIVLIVGISSIWLLDAVQTKPDPNSKPKIKVVSTTGMINDAVVNIGKDHVLAQSLMGPGVDPHLYKASEGDVAKLATARVIFYNGLHLEAKMSDILEKMGETRSVIAVAEAIPTASLLASPDYEGLYDPHVWFDVSLWKHAVEKVKEELIKADPAHQADYKENAAAYLAKLEALHLELIDLSKSVPAQQRVVVTAHDAFGYFGVAYGFQVKGLQGISTESEAGIRDIRELAQFITTNRIPAIFVESSVPKRQIEAVKQAVRARRFNVDIGGELFSDAMGSAGTLEGTYLGMVSHNINTIVKGLTKE